MDFGAKGDGITDDTAAIDHAAARGGGKILFPFTPNGYRIASSEDTSCKGKFSTLQFSIANPEFRVPMDRKKMHPTQTAVNLQNVSRVNVTDSQFCIGEQVGDTNLGKELMPNPCHTADNKKRPRMAVFCYNFGFLIYSVWNFSPRFSSSVKSSLGRILGY